MKKIQIAIYLRLSKEDKLSIEMQRSFLQKFVTENFSCYNLLEFCEIKAAK